MTLVVRVRCEGIGSELGIWTFFLTVLKKSLANRMIELGFRTSDQYGIPLENPGSEGFRCQSPRNEPWSTVPRHKDVRMRTDCLREGCLHSLSSWKPRLADSRDFVSWFRGRTRDLFPPETDHILPGAASSSCQRSPHRWPFPLSSSGGQPSVTEVPRARAFLAVMSQDRLLYLQEFCEPLFISLRCNALY